MNSFCNGLFGPGGRFEDRLVKDYDEIARRVASFRSKGQTIVLTMGTFDLAHVGHFRYLMRGGDLGDVLIVGVDDDEKTRKRKGDPRPIVPEEERLEQLLHTAYVKIVFLKQAGEERWRLIKTVRPDVLLLSESTGRPKGEEQELAEFCGKVVVLPPQATTSTSARIRLLHISGIAEVRRAMDALFDKMIGKNE